MTFIRTLSIIQKFLSQRKMKKKFTSERIDPSKPFVMRLDGHGFSKFTRGLHKPYDYNFHKAFVNTASLLMKEYHADTAYTHSDEISLLFYPKKKRNAKNSNVNNVHLNKEIECENESNLDLGQKHMVLTYTFFKSVFQKKPGKNFWK